mmetsp:Transcript_32793/g.94071  ORF Transcript_32793/g.94071 Transcript_32793/m.94071 type:complete len:273 (+) Transcript_32793:223-1041(+)
MRVLGSKFLWICLASHPWTNPNTTHAFHLSKTNITRYPGRCLDISKNLLSSLFSSSNDMPPASDPKSWRSLLEVSIAKSRKIRGSNYVQLATVEDGEPRCRTVVFRGFQKLDSGHSLSNECDSLSTTFKMCTDLRSRKVKQYKEQNTAEIVWWFPKSNEQYRVRGNLVLIGDESDDKALNIARKELWGNLSDPARESFLGSLVPGEAYTGEETASIPTGGRGEDGKPVPPPENFLLMLLDPTHVDYLLLGGDQYRQMDARKDGAWTFERVNP